MDEKLRLASALEVRARIAHLCLGDQSDTAVGEISLKKHQSSAVKRVESALVEFGGALLCDEVGMGKTYVATAIARAYTRVLIAAPAGLSTMWKRALLETEVPADFISFEKLSRTTSLATSELDLIIVDEAHHARNRATHRYRELESLARASKVLLLTATPVHNRRDDMLALLSLFLGDRAKALTRDELSRCVIRREHRQLQGSAPIPKVLPVLPLQIGDRPDVVDALMNLPPAIAVRDGGLAQTLVGRGLVHQWASSEAALHAALRKRIARATALVASLELGRHPTERDLCTWTYADGALQLGFAELLAAPSAGTEPLLLCVTRHRDALQRLLASLNRDAPLDAERTDRMLEIRRSHHGEKIVAFAQYAATATMFFRNLVRTGCVAMLTARGASVASGRITREETLAHFVPGTSNRKRAALAEQIGLLFTTDLLSEGVNLQAASIVVHLDLPWTAARMEQRVGRAARIGSAHASVQPYLFSPPASAVAVLQSAGIIRRKWQVAKRAIGSTNSPPVPANAASPPENGEKDGRETPTRLVELLRSILDTWRAPARSSPESIVACVGSAHSGFLAAVSLRGQMKLVVDLDGQTSTSIEAQTEACRAASGLDIATAADDYAPAFARLQLWLESETASSLAGTASSTVRRRRLLNRIDKAIEDAPPHARASRLELATRARYAVASQHSSAIEAELEVLARSDLNSEDWLAAVADFASLKARGVENLGRSPHSTTACEQSFTLHALLLLRRHSAAAS
jgi:superfamily II DNA or RNA helicase